MQQVQCDDTVVKAVSKPLTAVEAAKRTSSILFVWYLPYILDLIYPLPEGLHTFSFFFVEYDFKYAGMLTILLIRVTICYAIRSLAFLTIYPLPLEVTKDLIPENQYEGSCHFFFFVMLCFVLLCAK
jgi:hypothetical protein